MKRIFLLFFGLLFSWSLISQELSNFREKVVVTNSDTILLDSLSIVPNSEVIRLNGKILGRENYSIDYVRSYILPQRIDTAEWHISYRVFPLSFSKKYSHRSMEVMEAEDAGLYRFYSMKDEEEEFELFNMSGINKNGSISRGILFGNNQDLSVNSNLNLQLSGKVTEDINILAAITDDNIPIQADGNTQQLQEFDKVFIQLYNERYKLIAGDFLLTRPNSYFMNFTKKAQGGSFTARIYDDKVKDTINRGMLESSISAAVSKGKFARNVFNGIEGNQGPYRLTGANGEQFIIVLSGTERVFVDGKLLQRGQENEYVIDYNTAELTFTPEFLITKDQRIVVEFQYSEQNYARSLIHTEHSYKKDKLQLNFNLFSEQDNKNQPLHQELDEREERILQNAGDDLSTAIISGVEAIQEFEDDQVLYKMVDSLAYDSVLVFSTHPDSAKYRANFSFVGQNNGNYIRIRSTANGKVFKWIAPVNGVPQGDHEPVISLISPKKEQMLTVNGAYEFLPKTKLFVEAAFSNRDMNTFSALDNEDNQSYGMKMDFIHSQKIGEDSTMPTYWNSALEYEQVGRNFNNIEYYRDVEFARDWNIQDLNLKGNEYLIGAQSGFSKAKRYKIDYQFNSFVKGNEYQGLKNGYNIQFRKDGYRIESHGSYLTAESIISNSEFLRHYSTFEKELGIFTLGAYTEQERILFYGDKKDSLINNSRNRLNYQIYLEGRDSLRNNFYRLSYSQFYDHLPLENELTNAFVSKNYGLEFELMGNPRSRLKGTGTYRRLTVKNKLLSKELNIQPENTLLGRLDYDLSIMKGFISSNTFYQLGSGLENKKEYSFLEVPAGQGDFIFIDFNGNGIKELDEFEEAGTNNRFEANYIKIYTPTTEYEKVYTNQFSEILFIRPDVLWSSATGFKKLISLFSNKATFRSDKKTAEEEDIYNPFNDNVQDSALVSINSSLSNTVYFNRLDPIFGMEFFYLNNKGKILLTNGFQSREIDQKELRARYNFARVFTLEANVARILKFSASEFFAGRNYNIKSERVQPIFIYQPSVKFRLSFNAIHEQKKNTIGTEVSLNRTLGGKMEFNEAGKGSITLEVDYVNIDFNSSDNSSLSYEMLEGLQPGSNFVWNVSWQRNLSNNLQLNITYHGRSSEELNTIHTGGMQVRAFF